MRKISTLTLTLFITLSLMIFLGYGCNEEKASICPNCNMEPNMGPCEAHIVKYYFDEVEGKCKEFIWGGCDGAVPFERLEECEACECIR